MLPYNMLINLKKFQKQLYIKKHAKAILDIFIDTIRKNSITHGEIDGELFNDGFQLL